MGVELSLLPSIIILGLIAVAALWTAVSRPSPPENVTERRAAARVFVIAIAAQCIHFTEEATTGLNERFPALFGLPAVPQEVFVTLNLVAIGIWIVSVPGLRAGQTGAFFVAWFLALASVFNVVAHPVLALIDGRYFPGLVSSLLVGATGIWFCRRLYTATRLLPPTPGVGGAP